MSARNLVCVCLVSVLALVAAACGGAGEVNETTSAPATTQAAANTTAAPSGGDAPTTTAAAAPITEAPGGGDAPTGAENKAIVTVGDTTYEFDAEAHVVGKCDPDFFGAFFVIAALADGRDGNLEIFIVPEGNTNHNETSRIDVGVQRTEDEREWRADEDGGQGADPGVSAVTSATIDGNTVTGTASFIDIYQGDDATAEGTFTVTCPAA